MAEERRVKSHQDNFQTKIDEINSEYFIKGVQLDERITALQNKNSAITTENKNYYDEMEKWSSEAQGAQKAVKERTSTVVNLLREKVELQNINAQVTNKNETLKSTIFELQEMAPSIANEGLRKDRPTGINYL